MTASTKFGDAKEALNLQVTTYLSKPVKLDELVGSVEVGPSPGSVAQTARRPGGMGARMRLS